MSVACALTLLLAFSVDAEKVCTPSLDMTKGFRSCKEAPTLVAARPKPEVSLTTLSFLTTFGATLLGSVVHAAFPVHVKQHSKLSGWQRALGERLENRAVVLTVVIAIMADLAATLITSLEIGGAELVELAEGVGFKCLLLFAAEQLLHLVAFGWSFFSHPWFVLDLLAVSLSAAVELNEEIAAEYKLIGVVRMWKLAVFAFDVALLKHEAKEALE